MRHTISLGLLCAALHAGTANAQEAEPEPASPRPTVAATRPHRPVHLVLAMGIDGGSDKIATVTFTDGSTQSLNAGAGFSLSAGLSFLEANMGDVTLDVVAAAGFKAWDAGADNGRVKYLGWPLELLGRFKYKQLRLGAGIDYAMNPKAYSTGDLAGYEERFDDALGFVAQIEWADRAAGAKAGYFLGARVVMQRFDSKTYPGFSYNASAFGVQLGLDI